MSVDPQDQLGSLKQRTLQLGELFDKQQQAQAAVDKLDAQIAAVKPQAAKPGAGWWCCSPAVRSAPTPQEPFQLRL